jgi:hypothetical protein
MEIKLIKTEVNYLLKNEEGVIIASTSIKKGINSLSKQNCDELFGVFNVEKLADKYFSDKPENVSERIGFKVGFIAAMALNKDKVFTLEDMRKSYYVGYEDGKSGATFFQQLIQSLQQPKEIEVMIVMDTDCTGEFKYLLLDKGKPKLDSEGCLILKRVV